MKKMFKLVITGGAQEQRAKVAEVARLEVERFGKAVTIAEDSCGFGFGDDALTALIHSEDSLTAMTDGDIVIFRGGSMDVMSPHNESAHNEKETMYEKNTVLLRDRRYDAVFVLKGADEQQYNAILRLWTGHPHLRVVCVEDGDDRKICKLVRQTIGLPQHIEIERKYLVDSNVQCDAGDESEIWQTYLRFPDGEKARIRKRGKDGTYNYFYTRKTRVGADRSVEDEQMIDEDDYIRLLQYADSSRQTIHKRRRCFVWDEQYFELDTFVSPQLNYKLLEIEDAETASEVRLPACFSGAIDVTGVDEYRNSWISKVK